MADSLTLYQIKEEYKDLVEQVDEALFNTGEVSPELETALVINQQQLIEKTANYSHILKIIESRKDMADKELERVEAFKKRQTAVEDRLKYHLLQALLVYGKEDSKGVRSLELGTFRLSTRKSSTVEIEDLEKVPDKYQDATIKMPKELWETIKSTLNPADLDECKASFSPKKAVIKKEAPVAGASIEEKVNLSVK